MDDAVGLIIGLLILALIAAAIVLPIVALVVSVNTRKKLNQTISRLESLAGSHTTRPDDLSVLQQLKVRVARLETESVAERPTAPETTEEPARAEAQPGNSTATVGVRPPPPPARREIPPAQTSPLFPGAPTISTAISTSTMDAEKIESIIGRRWLGWAAVALILFAAAFFLKYAFDNRWIGELGRVAIGVAAGLTLTGLGYHYHKRKWRVFSQILTGGGAALLYLSVYASFGYYHLVTQKAAFIYLVIVIVETAALALLYNAPAIATMALIGGYLVPLLLHSDRDEYVSLFGYIFALDAGALLFFRRWRGPASVAFLSTHVLFWLWYVEHYEIEKLGPVIVFHLAVFTAFLLQHVMWRWLRRPSAVEDLKETQHESLSLGRSLEDFSLLIADAFIFFATLYFFLNPNYHEWMGAFALGMAALFALMAKLVLSRQAAPQTERLILIGVSLIFLTIAVPIQLSANWITIAWATEAVLILWAGAAWKSEPLRALALGLFVLALFRLVLLDTPYDNRPPFTPVFNKYFLSSLFVIACLFVAALICHKLSTPKQISRHALPLALLIAGIITLWFLMTIETHTYFAARAALDESADINRHQRWLGQMTLSIVWSVYAAVLATIGFVRRAPAIRWAALSLFALTVVKVMMVDISVLEQFYRIVAFLVLGLLSLGVAWGYNRAFHSRKSSAEPKLSSH